MTPATRALLAKVVKKVGVPAAHTFWQTFTGTVGVWWVASGVNAAHQVSSVAGGERFLVAGATAVVAAAFSATKTTLAGLVQVLPKIVAL